MLEAAITRVNKSSEECHERERGNWKRKEDMQIERLTKRTRVEREKLVGREK